MIGYRVSDDGLSWSNLPRDVEGYTVVRYYDGSCAMISARSMNGGLAICGILRQQGFAHIGTTSDLSGTVTERFISAPHVRGPLVEHVYAMLELITRIEGAATLAAAQAILDYYHHAENHEVTT